MPRGTTWQHDPITGLPRIIPQEKQAAERQEDVFTYKNYRGDIYYLHQCATKTGKPRYYFAKTIREGTLNAIPDGFEVSESPNCIVSVVRIRSDGPKVEETDISIVKAVISSNQHLKYCAVHVLHGEIIIYEPQSGLAPGGSDQRELEAYLGRSLQSFMEDRLAKARRSPVLKFQRVESKDNQTWCALRWVFKGENRWIHLGSGTLEPLARRFIPHIGRNSFYELY